MKSDVNRKTYGRALHFDPQTCLKLGGRVTQTSAVVLRVYKSTHAIHHIKGN